MGFHSRRYGLGKRKPCNRAAGFQAGECDFGSGTLQGEPRVPEPAAEVLRAVPCEKAAGSKPDDRSLESSAVFPELRVLALRESRGFQAGDRSLESGAVFPEQRMIALQESRGFQAGDRSLASTPCDCTPEGTAGFLA